MGVAAFLSIFGNRSPRHRSDFANLTPRLSQLSQKPSLLNNAGQRRGGSSVQKREENG
jgi:hypothetical protein